MNDVFQSSFRSDQFAKPSVKRNAKHYMLLWISEVTVDQRMRIRLATTHAIHEAKQAADVVYDAAGASAVFSSGPFERRFRDLHTVTQQGQGRKAHYETVGSFMLGNEPDLSAL